MRYTFIILITVLTAFHSFGQSKLDSLIKESDIKINLILARTSDWTPYKDNYENIIQLKKSNDTTTFVQYAVKVNMDSQEEIKWRKMIDNETIREFHGALLHLSEDAIYDIEHYESWDTEFPQDYFIIKSTDGKVSFYTLRDTGRKVMDILVNNNAQH